MIRDDEMYFHKLCEDALAICKKRDWNLHWEGRAAHLFIESSELMEAVRGKHGNSTEEAADVLFVLMSILASNNIKWGDVVYALNRKMNELWNKPRYAGESFSELGYEI